MNARATGAYSVSPAGWRPTPAQPYPPGYLTDPYLPLPAANVTPNAPLTQGVIHVFLPTADAAVYLNGQKMRGTGTERKLTSPVLPSNGEFQYWVSATFDRGGQTLREYRKVVLGAGEYAIADFTRSPQANPISLPPGPVDPNSVNRD